ncbi:MAG: response regulator [Bacteroidetes bacterium]|nr:response regulator [Bacteroidota bacterium]
MKDLRKILYIGSSSENISRIKGKAGISITVAESNLQAVNFLKSGGNTDAIICEAVIPGGDGFLIHEWLRERSVFNGIPFILVSSEFREEQLKDAFARRIDDYFVEPLPQTEDLINRISFLSNFRMKTENTSTDTVKQPVYRMPKSKRLFDIAVASGALLFLSPVMLVIMLAIRLESKGRVYYISKRWAGKHLILQAKINASGI